MKYVATDTETTGLVWQGTREDWGFYPARPFAFSFCDQKGGTAYVRWEVDPKTRRVIVPPPRHGDWRVLRDVYCDPKIAKVFYNRNFDQRMIELTGIELDGPLEDAIAIAHGALGGDSLSFALKFICEQKLGYPKDDEDELKTAVQEARREAKSRGWCIAAGPLFSKEPWKADMWLPIDDTPKKCERYSVCDAERTMLVWMTWSDDVLGNPGKERTYRRELRLQPVTKRMEDRGIRIHPETVDSLKIHYEKRAKKYLDRIHEQVGRKMNLRSTKQLSQYFFEEKGYSPTKWTKKGNPSLNHLALADLAKIGDPVATDIMNYRTCVNANSLFFIPFSKFKRLDRETGEWIIHTNIRQIGPSTGRMAAADPNLMNIASETTGFSLAKQRMKPRACFGPREGYIWYLPDFSQIEVWCFAFLADDPTMKEALVGGYDYHGYIAQNVYASRPDYKGREDFYRKRAKIIQFCKLFGGGVKKIAAILEEPINEAKVFVADYENRLPGAMRYMRRVEKRARHDGQVVNQLGRHFSVEPHLAYRGTNYLVQGTAADIFKEGIAECSEMLDREWPGTMILLPIHDELIIEVPMEYHSQELMHDIRESLRVGGPMAGIEVPLPINFKIVRERWNWAYKVDV